jgi:hypothetical protein
MANMLSMTTYVTGNADSDIGGPPLQLQTEVPSNGTSMAFCQAAHVSLYHRGQRPHVDTSVATGTPLVLLRGWLTCCQ